MRENFTASNAGNYRKNRGKEKEVRAREVRYCLPLTARRSEQMTLIADLLPKKKVFQKFSGSSFVFV
jgi:hypothetical protein